MRTRTKVIGSVAVIVALVAFMFSNFMLTTPSTAPSSPCVLSASGQFTENGKVCDMVNYVVFKNGMTVYNMFGELISTNPYFYHLTTEGWKFLNSSNGGSYFGFTTHNLLTNAGVTFIQNQLHSASTTTYTVTGLGLSSSTTSPSASDAQSTGPSAGPCQENNVNEITVFGLTRTFGTYAAGTASGGSISPTVKETWTAYGTVPSVQVGCAWASVITASPYGTGGTLYAENTFSAVNFNAGDQLTITWTFTYSG